MCKTKIKIFILGPYPNWQKYFGGQVFSLYWVDAADSLLLAHFIGTAILGGPKH